MNEQLYQKWIDALESGEYQDGRQYLRYDGDELTLYCCLGVLCELSELGTWIPTSTTSKIKGYSVDNEVVYNFSLPNELIKELSFNTMDGDFNANDITDELLSEILHHVKLANGADIETEEQISLIEINDGFVPQDDSDITSPFTLIAKVLREAPESLFNK